MTKVLLILENAPTLKGGIERHCYNIIKLFTADRDISFDVLSKENVKHTYIKSLNKIVFNKKDFCHKIKESAADVIHIHGFASFIIPQAINCACKLKKKIIYTAHFHPFYTLENPIFGKLFFYSNVAWRLKKIDVIITINKEDTAFYKKYNDNVMQLPHWLDNGIVPPVSDKNKKIVLFVGRAEANKGLNHLYSLPTNKYEIHCVSSGTFDRQDFILHKNVTDVELYSLYSQASVVIIPSRYEAFSYVALEALMSGTPIVVSDRVRIIDYLRDFIGKGVEVFHFGDFLDFNKSVEKAAAQTVNVNQISDIFSEDKVKNRLSHIYKT